MENLLAVDVEQGRCYLDEHVHDFLLMEEALGVLSLPDPSEHIALLTEARDDTQSLLMVYKTLLIANDVWMVES